MDGMDGINKFNETSSLKDIKKTGGHNTCDDTFDNIRNIFFGLNAHLILLILIFGVLIIRLHMELLTVIMFKTGNT